MSNNLENSNFKNLLYKNESNSIKDFILENGKEGKPFCPISFDNNGGNINASDNKENESDS